MADLERYRVELRFNGRTSGGGQVLSAVVEAVGEREAIEKAVLLALRDPKNGQSIFVTGATVDLAEAARKELDLYAVIAKRNPLNKFKVSGVLGGREDKRRWRDDLRKWGYIAHVVRLVIDE